MKVKIEKRQNETKINPRLHGQFIEFLGNAINDGIWVGKESKIPNINGMRLDVINALKEIEPPIIRWTGGVFADHYNWQDGVGEKRKKVFNEGFGTYSVETNEFGTDEFLEFASLIHSEPWINVNLLTGSAREMTEWMEYINRKQSTYLSKKRKDSGHEKPYDVNYWGIGNEVWGGGGMMTPEQYVADYRKYATAAPTFALNQFSEDSRYFILSGADANKPKERRYWTKSVMKELARARPPKVDGYDLHWYNWYLGNEFSASATDFNANDWYQVIKGATELEDILKEQYNLIQDGLDQLPEPEGEFDQKLEKMDLILGEWGNWYGRAFFEAKALYQQNTMRDAITTAIVLDILHSNADKVKMASMAQTINVLNALILTNGEQFVLTPVYDIFKMYKVHRNNDVLDVTITDENSDHVKFFASINDKIIYLNVINFDLTETISVDIDLPGLVLQYQKEELAANDMHETNTFEDPNHLRAVIVEQRNNVSANELFDISIKPMSVSVFKIVLG
ncbi:alpha-L-arabinofuranosidase [Leuconostoc mesenteroides subsp. mesenteroides]|uniref:alpha-L-arabinofuranosidase C-terminal domain-containing protein n=1 Tax=Leuconostoc mesenteroides TaxID=1245 RepID=UPI000A00E8D7|nr:alpha-L-arabinofuranosidase C-terminal domain-containing protein [Leuconostoc mesenteroides]ARN63337.1 alpha-L-arabinofuranosidase [Leuconostoc mesenteroides subsp. mesenteroides]MDV8926785.1 alpha-L-arabinofuranosidase [Leuconostoc mesenteroides]ORI90852.1 alpha-L-arabinofuranosidase [Leuconostoc mesenteroides subsp. mesenteroides]ORI92439.1 alpha-L-arabinofuranosidase [Leuconostoc mesenteroides subsp. mesenteroides]